MITEDAEKKLLTIIEKSETELFTSEEITKEEWEEATVLIKDVGLDRLISLINSNYERPTYEMICEIEDNARLAHERVQEIKENIEIRKLKRSGEIFVWEKIKTRFKDKGVFTKYKSFKWKRFVELVKNPPLELKNHKGETIDYDEFIVRKIVVALMQMIGDKMDLWIMNVGAEGSGKSCLASQYVLYIYYFLTEIGIIDYKYKVQNIIKGSLRELLEYIDNLSDDDHFNISDLDEAEDLDRMNFREEDNKKFKSTMRRSRKQHNIIFMNTPQVGEIDTSVTLARMNFIFYCKMDYDDKTGLLKKGDADLYIIPRTDSVYSKRHQKNITKHEIKTALAKQFEKKTDYYKDMPKEIIIHSFKFKDVWGFDEDDYDKHIRKENKNRQLQDGNRLTINQMYILYRYSPPLRDWYDKLEKKTITTGSKDYETLKKMLSRINRFFDNNEEMLRRMETQRRYRTDKVDKDGETIEQH